METLVVRHLYNRPLESLLATWGVGLILIQFIRIIYGDNIGVNSPTWARGGYEISQDIILPYARLYLLGLSAFCVGFIYFIIKKTRFGDVNPCNYAKSRHGQQSWSRTRKIDRLYFCLRFRNCRSCRLWLDNHRWSYSDMGQTNFIVDSFLVVVTGGVGELVG